jgi:Domain of unknown function (DUF4265)
MPILAPGESEDDLVELKLFFEEDEVPIDEKSWMKSVSVFAIPLPGGLFGIRSIPLTRLAWGDVVRVRRNRRVGEIVSRSGHRTLRVLFSDDDSGPSLRAIERGGGRSEPVSERMFLIDVPTSKREDIIADALAQATNARSEYSDETDELLPEAWREAVRNHGRVKRTFRLRFSPIRLLLALVIGLAVVAALEFSEPWGAVGVAAVVGLLIVREQARRRRNRSQR